MEQLQQMAWVILLLALIVAGLTFIFLVVYAAFKVVRDYEDERRDKRGR